ncbi:hypothetical protein ACH5RR_035965 [Cinchona calisaya]|uniref:Uncharacterized protein n=1 Tax=Cinchona calisaya TaxID=153742 RepID=A0ABD2Y1U4_9GENT
MHEMNNITTVFCVGKGVDLKDIKFSRIWRLKFDEWHPLGPLYKKFSEGLLKSFGFSKQPKVADFIQNGTWKWPKGRKYTVEVRQLKDETAEDFTPTPGDKVQLYAMF